MQDDHLVRTTEQRILEAAKQEFIAKGFAGARTTSIAEKAGVTHAMLHYYFRTKEKLFDRILLEVVGLLRKILFSSVEEIELPFDVMIRKLIERHFDFLVDNPDLPRFIISEMNANPEKVWLFKEKIREYAPMFWGALQIKIDKAVEEGVCRRISAVNLVLDVVSLNLFVFMAPPVIKAALGTDQDDYACFLAGRKEENVDTIMRKIRP
ncbi:MAG: TetR/AcrR family transcriptional regulator [Duncaniella sp.]|nr:TetR/AcrR family transcriptional regulator [Duncaniella sp.]